MKSLPKNTSEFVREFQGHLDCFVVIGGTPTLLHIEQREGSAPRTTKDLDIVILDIAEDGRENEFLTKFAGYIKANGYECKKLSTGEAQSYRFTDPKNDLAPKIIEISTRRKEGIPLDQPAQRIEEFEMSAIVCEPYFVDLLKKHGENFEVEKDAGLSLPVAKPALLILMKAYAVANLKKSENKDDQAKVKKHLNDILRLARVLTDGDKMTVPTVAYKHLEGLLAEGETHFSLARLESCGWKGQKRENVHAILLETITSE